MLCDNSTFAIVAGVHATDPVITNVAVFNNRDGQLIEIDGFQNIPWTSK